MKIIDLYNKIANGEEVPKKIRVHYRVFEKHLNPNAYLNIEDEDYYKYLTDLPKLYDDDRDWLNEEVEIIEEEDKKIEKIPYQFNLNYIDSKLDSYTKEEINKTINNIYKKINEMIDKINNDK